MSGVFAGSDQLRRSDEIIEIAYRGAVDVLRACSSPQGLKGSAGSLGHREVWARDSMISLLGGVLCGNREVGEALLSSLATLRRYQTEHGAIPNHVDGITGRCSFRAYADGGLWFVIGCSILAPDLDAIARALQWYEYQDVDASGVLSVHEAADWQDLFCTRGKTLYVNCLYVAALRQAARLASEAGELAWAGRWRSRAGEVSKRINELFWYAGDGDTLRHVSHSFSTPNAAVDSLGRKRYLPRKRILVDEQYYLPYLGFRVIGEWFDSFGHILAILSGVAGEEKTARTFDLIDRLSLAAHPIKALHPPVYPGDPDWREYYGELNAPNQYHNGGIWPFLGGFYVAALVKAGRDSESSAALERLALLNCQGNFNEWHHGTSLEPTGVERQAWSAGMFLYAAECVRRGTAIFFE